MARWFSCKKRLAALVLGSLVVSLAAPTVAVAGSSRHRSHREWRDSTHGDSHHRSRHRSRHHNRRYDHDRHSGHSYRNHDYRNHDYRNHSNRNHNRNHGYSHRYNRHHRRDRGHHEYRNHSSYYCAPCNHGFGSRRDFHAHLSGHHHIAAWQLPFVIIQTALGWIFHG